MLEDILWLSIVLMINQICTMAQNKLTYSVNNYDVSG